jgi:hypothetical protein
MDNVHVMVDLEALGNVPHTGILIAIGAIAFTMDNEIVYPTVDDFAVCARGANFFYPIDTVNQSCYGFIIEDETLQWWLAKERREQLCEFINSQYKVVLRDACEKFAWWLQSVCPQQKALKLWSHGVTYDCIHLAQKWPIVLKQSFNTVCPFRQMRDTRTIFATYEEAWGRSPYPDVMRQRPHHPLEDAWMQAKAVQTAWKGLVRD